MRVREPQYGVVMVGDGELWDLHGYQKKFVSRREAEAQAFEYVNKFGQDATMTNDPPVEENKFGEETNASAQAVSGVLYGDMIYLYIVELPYESNRVPVPLR